MLTTKVKGWRDKKEVRVVALRTTPTTASDRAESMSK